MTIASRLESIENRISQACTRAGRERSSVTLVGVSKRHPAEAISEALNTTNLRHFGENYVQEYVEKRQQLGENGAIWHFIGHLQRNKVRQLMAFPPALIHSVDSIALIDTLERIMAECHPNQKQPILIELRIGDEDSEKTGLDPQALDEVAAHLAQCPHLDWRGLMLIPPLGRESEASRPYFQAVKSKFDAINVKRTQPLTVLSYGMSDDFEVAIEEGATHIRIGTAIFGARL
jgi:pyridoxal phosphate enzyme (YggS family)